MGLWGWFVVGDDFGGGGGGLEVVGVVFRRLVRLLFMPYIAYAKPSFLLFSISCSSFVFCLLSSEFNFGFPFTSPNKPVADVYLHSA